MTTNEIEGGTLLRWSVCYQVRSMRLSAGHCCLLKITRTCWLLKDWSQMMMALQNNKAGQPLAHQTWMPPTVWNISAAANAPPTLYTFLLSLCRTLENDFLTYRNAYVLLCPLQGSWHNDEPRHGTYSSDYIRCWPDAARARVTRWIKSGRW